MSCVTRWSPAEHLLQAALDTDDERTYDRLLRHAIEAEFLVFGEPVPRVPSVPALAHDLHARAWLQGVIADGLA